MKQFLCLILFSSSLFAQSFNLEIGKAVYQVKGFGKTVTGESKELKGKMNCTETECEFLVAAPVKSFISSDANRDENMVSATEASSIPVASGSGKFPKGNLKLEKWNLNLEVDFHKVKRTYEAQIKKTGENSFDALFTLKLEQHKIVRPSLFSVKIEDDVPMTFKLKWQLNKEI